MIGHAVFYGIAITWNCAMISGTILSPLKVDPSMFRLYKSSPSRNNEFEYAIVKRGPQSQAETQESPDSKERRSQMGSSFIRFGRSRFEGNLENADYSIVGSGGGGGGNGNELDTSSRIARGRSDVIIRFGRSGLKNFRGIGLDQRLITRADLNKLLGYTGNYNNKKEELFAGQPALMSDRGEPGESHFRPSNDLDRVTIVCSNILAANYFTPDPDSINANDSSSSSLYLGKLVRLCNSLGLGPGEENDEINRRKSKIIEILEDASQAESNKRQ